MLYFLLFLCDFLLHSLLLQLANGLRGCFSSFLLIALHSVYWFQINSFPADVLEGGAGDVVNHRIQHAVEVCQAHGGVKRRGQVLHSGTHLRFGKDARKMTGLDPDHRLCDVAWEEANDEDYHYHCDEAQSLLDLCVLGQLSPSQMANNADCAEEDHKQWYEERQDKCKFMPRQINTGLSLNGETLTVGRVASLYSEDVHSH